MFYKSATREDLQEILALGKRELGQDFLAQRLAEDLENCPSEVARDEEGLLGFVVSEELNSDVLMIRNLVLRNKNRCDKTGRCLLELIESRAMSAGYYALVLPEAAQKALGGCDYDDFTFAGYQKIYDTGSSSLLLKCLG